ncbi:MAG: peptidylprolyl isomerase [Oligosphaeraceae bacterium]|nr:peptidylprolyl isomerase [Oligosphaeraceae bacterium]
MKLSILPHIFLLTCFAASLLEAQPFNPATAASATKPNPALLMAYLRPTDAVLEVGDMRLTWQEFQPLARRIMGQNQAGDPNIGIEQLQKTLQRIALRGLYLQEARSRGIELSEEEKKNQEANLAAGLQGNKQGLSKDEFIKQFSENESTLMTLNYADAQKVVKLGDEVFKDIDVSDNELKLMVAMEKSMQASFRKQNEARRKAVLELLQEPRARTDEGFAAIAREYSEGAEAGAGGKLDYKFLREDLAEVNQIKEFNVQLGETSGLLETDTAFRVMRVLEKIPAENPDEPERLIVAQWLFKKSEEKEDIDIPELRERLLLRKKQKAMEQFGESLQSKYPVKCPLFPEGLFKHLAKETQEEPSDNE